MNRWALLGAAIASEVSATLSLRAMDGWDHPWWIVVVIAGYGGSFVILAALLKSGLAVGVVYGIWAATGVALTAVLGSALFGDPFTAVMGLGIVLVVAGVLLVETGSHSGETSRSAGAGES